MAGTFLVNGKIHHCQAVIQCPYLPAHEKADAVETAEQKYRRASIEATKTGNVLPREQAFGEYLVAKSALQTEEKRIELKFAMRKRGADKSKVQAEIDALTAKIAKTPEQSLDDWDNHGLQPHQTLARKNTESKKFSKIQTGGYNEITNTPKERKYLHNGVLHRTDGPALLPASGGGKFIDEKDGWDNKWYVNGNLALPMPEGTELARTILAEGDRITINDFGVRRRGSIMKTPDFLLEAVHDGWTNRNAEDPEQLYMWEDSPDEHWYKISDLIKDELNGGVYNIEKADSKYKVTQ